MQRAVEDEFVGSGTQYGTGMMVWSPLAGGLLSGKYQSSERHKPADDGRLQTLAGTSNPAFAKFTDRNWVIVAELERVAREVGRSMALIAVHLVANRAGVASVIVGATKQHQLEDNLASLDFTLPATSTRSVAPNRSPRTRFSVRRSKA